MSLSLPSLPSSNAIVKSDPTQQLAPAVVIEGPEFRARDQIDPDKLPELEEYVDKLVASPDFDPMFFIGIIDDAGVSQVPILDSMLETVRARDTGELGKRLIESRDRMRRMNNDLPELDEKFVKLFQVGKARIEEVVGVVRHVARQIKKALRSYENLKNLVDEDAAYIENQAELTMEAVLQADRAAQEADQRTKKLLILSAMLEILQEKMAARLDEIAHLLEEKPSDKQRLTDEQERLEGISPLLVKRLSSLKPLTHMGNTNERRFLDIRNVDAVVAISLKDLAGPGIVQWKTDITSSLMFIQAEIAMMVAQTGIDFINEQAKYSAEDYQQYMEGYVALMRTLIVSVKSVQDASKAVVAAHDKSVEALEAAIEVGKQASRAVEQGRNEIETAQNKASVELRRLLRS